MVSLDESGDILRSLTMWSNQVFKAVFQQHTWEKINHFSFCLIWKCHGHVMILVRFCKILKTCGCLWQIMSGILYIHSISANETEKLTTWHFSVNFWSLYKWRRRTIAYKEDRSTLFPWVLTLFKLFQTCCCMSCDGDHVPGKWIFPMKSCTILLQHNHRVFLLSCILFWKSNVFFEMLMIFKNIFVTPNVLISHN